MKVLLVTGASSGIGCALALRAARAGYGVVGVGRNGEALDALERKVRSEHGSIVTAVFDVSEPTNAAQIVELARRTFGRIDVLVNNAGHTAVGALSEQSDAALRMQFGTHVIGPVAIVREALPLLRASRGIVFMVGSGVARVPVSGLGAYAPSKAATRSATSILRRELKPDGIAVTYVDPGVVDTPFMTRAGMSGAPTRLLVTPEAVARKILVAVASRPRVLNAVPWQTMFVGLAEFFPVATDFVLERNSALVGTQSPAHVAAAALPPTAPETQSTAPPAQGAVTAATPTAFETAIEPVRRRMERVKLTEAFVRGLLELEAELDPAEVALRWAGMPNKNERAATIEVLDALAEAGFLQRDAERYRVVRTPD
ncbi:MAG: SDR family NAD(P)-dependent oxidoreductase [Candidatus Elarobacter sp.]